jgi:WD40 repeat protein
MALSADGRQLAAATRFSGGLFAWDLEKPEAPPVRSVESGPLDTAGPLAVRFEEDDRSIMLLDERGDLHRWDRKNPRLQPLARPRYAVPEPPFEGGTEDYKHGAFLAGGKTLAVIGRSMRLQVVDVATGKERYRVKRARLFIPSPDHRTIAIATVGKHAENQWVAETDLARTPMLKTMATDGAIILLDGETGKERLKIDVPGSEVRALAFAPDGKTLAATTAGKTDRIHLLDVATGKETRTIESPPLRSPALVFTPDGTRLITGMADGSVLVWGMEPVR